MDWLLIILSRKRFWNFVAVALFWSARRVAPTRSAVRLFWRWPFLAALIL